MIGKKINQLATELAPTTTDLTIIGDPVTGVSKKITLEQLGAIFGGAVSFYTTLGDFPVTGVIDIIYCAKDTKKLYLWSGSAYVEVFPSQSLLDTYQLRSEKGVSNGYASLDVNGKVPIGQLPNSIMEYKGTWNAATNTPTLANGTGDTGDVYICSVAGTVNFGGGPITFAVGDYTVYSGSIWQRSSGAVGTVTSVAVSRSGDALAITGSPITTSGTINIGFAGTGAQYIKGDGTLATFPSIISQAQNLVTEVYNNTGATLTKGTIVYISGGQGNLPTVTKALATGDSTSAQTYGVVQTDITNMNNGYVVVEGRLGDLDTQAYANGTQLYLSATTAGTWTSTKQYAPNHLVYVGIVVRSHPTQGVVEVKIMNGFEMDELHNVAAQSPSNNDILQYKTATSLWTKVAGTTSNIAEGSNLYYTDARSRAALSFTAGSGAYNSTTGVITIPTNTNQLTNGAAFITLASLSAGAGISYNNTTGVIASTITQYTDALARAAISLTTTGTSGAATYNSTTGVLNVPQYAPDLSGYVPTSRTLTINGTAFDLSANRSWSVGTVTSVGLSSATSGVTIGSTPITTSGTITLAIATASGSQQGLLSSTDWTTFNNKQNALTNPVTGTGTTNYLPKFTGTSTIGNSVIQEASGFIGIGITPARILNIYDTNSATLYQTPTSGTGAGNGFYVGQTGDVSYIWNYNNFPIILATNNTPRLTLSASGNLGLGVTPSASADPAFQSRYGVFIGNDETNINNNAFFSSGWKYAQTGSFANRYYQNGYNGGHQWLIAPSGTAGNAISFTQAMTLNASGNLSIGNTNDSFRLDVSGTGRFTGNVWLQSDLRFGTDLAGANTGIIKWIGSSGTYPNALAILTWADAKDIQIGGRDVIFASESGAQRARIASTGAATFSSSVTAGTFVRATGGTGASSGKGVEIGYESGDFGTIIAYDRTTPSFKRLSLNDNLHILGNGNVGIGTTNPTYRLDVTGSSMTRGALVIDNNGTDTSPTEYIRFERNSQGSANYFNSIFSSTGSGTNLMQFRLSNTSGGQGTVMTLTGTGNVGIGTPSPACKLHVEGPSASYGQFRITSTSNNTGEASINFGRTDQAIDNRWTVGQGTASIGDSFGFYSGGANRFVLTTSGAATFSSTIQTGEPDTGWGRAAIKIGASVSGVSFNTTRYLPVSVDGTVYYINLNSSTP